MNYEVIASTSAGNSVLIEDMLFDVGVPFGKLKKRLYDTRYIFVTHAHSDHLNLKTALRIQKEFPRIQWIANHDVGMRIPVHHMVGDVTKLQFKDRFVQSFQCVHDVPTHGFVVEIDGVRIIYATDTHTLENAPKGPYDYLFIESNHDESKLAQIMGKGRKLYGYDAWENGMRHLSTQKSKAFYYINRRNKDSKWIELHKSKRFY